MLLLNAFPAFSQFFNPVSNPNSTILGVEGKKKWDGFSNDNQYSSKGVFTFSSLSAVTASDGKIEIDIPGDSCGTIRFVTHSFRGTDGENFLWYGVGDDATNTCECGDSYFLLQKIQGRFVGDIVSGNSVFKIQTISGGYSALLKYDNNNEKIGYCGQKFLGGYVPPANLIEPPQKGVQNVESMGGCMPGQCNVVRVAFFFSSVVSAYDAGIVALESLGQLNTSILNSGISTATLQFENAGTFLFSGFTENLIDGLFLDLNTFSTSNFVQNTMNLPNVQADIAVLFVSDKYLINQDPFPPAEVFGATRPDKFLSIVALPFSTSSRKTFVHEIGHQFGAMHNSCALEATATCIPTTVVTTATAHKFKTGNWPNKKKHMTVMHEQGDLAASKRLFHFSNPMVNFKSVATGTTARNNARAVSGAACPISNNRPCPSVGALQAKLTVYNSPTNAGGSVGFTSLVFGGTPPYIYKWYVAGNSVYGPPISTSSDASFSTPSGCNGCFYSVKLEVMSSDGMTSVDFGFFYTNYNYLPSCGSSVVQPFAVQDRNSVEQISLSNDLIRLFPNPADQKINLQMNLKELQAEETVGFITIYDAIGQQIQRISATSANVSDGIQLDLHGFPTGIYIVECYFLGIKQYKRFVKN